MITIGSQCCFENFLSLFSFRYYLMEDKTAEDYYNMYGRRWFKTGDIGQMEEDGTLRIIDRCVDKTTIPLVSVTAENIELLCY